MAQIPKLEVRDLTYSGGYGYPFGNYSTPYSAYGLPFGFGYGFGRFAFPFPLGIAVPPYAFMLLPGTW